MENVASGFLDLQLFWNRVKCSIKHYVSNGCNVPIQNKCCTHSRRFYSILTYTYFWGFNIKIKALPYT